MEEEEVAERVREEHGQAEEEDDGVRDGRDEGQRRRDGQEG